MKELRVQFTETEYEAIRHESECLGLSLKELVHIRAQGIFAEDTPVCKTKLFCTEMAKCREVLNQIIRREAMAEIKLFEDDIIFMEMSLSALEKIVADFVREQIKDVKHSGDIDI